MHQALGPIGLKLLQQVKMTKKEAYGNQSKTLTGSFYFAYFMEGRHICRTQSL